MAFVIPAFAALGAAAGAGGAGAAAAGMAIASTAVSAVGVGAQALAARNSAKFQEGLAKQQGRQASDQASIKASEVARDTKQKLAAARAGALQNGFEISGSMTDLLYQTERSGTLDYLTAVYDGSVQRTGLDATAKNYRRQASNALIQGAVGIGSKALGGVAQVYGMRGAQINVAGT